MDYRPLGKTGLEVSTVALGCWQFGGGDLWGDHSAEQCATTVHAALDSGINLFDTAEGYGDGLSERMLGKALGPRRKDVLIATKVSRASRDGVATSCERSLKNLGIDAIDLYQIHWPRRDTAFEDSMAGLEKLRDGGKIRHIGVSNFGPRDFDDLVKLGRPESNQLLYSMLARMIEDEVVPRCVENDVSILCYSPLAQGLLTGRWRSADEVPDVRVRNRLFSSRRPATEHDEPGCEQAMFECLERIRCVAGELRVPMAALALAWCLHQPGITSVLAGASSPEQVAQNVRAATLSIEPPLLARLRSATDPIKEHLMPNLDLMFTGDQARYR